MAAGAVHVGPRFPRVSNPVVNGGRALVAQHRALPLAETAAVDPALRAGAGAGGEQRGRPRCRRLGFGRIVAALHSFRQ
jgi:hypothetical protein